MKGQHFKLQIDNPCGQDWTSMSPNEIGKYCSNCSKTVVDFTTLSDSEIIKFVEQSSDKICGRLTNQQLNRFLAIKQSPNNSNLYKILAGLMLVGTTENSLATEKSTLKTEVILPAENQEFATQHIEKNEPLVIDTLKNVVKGKVIDAFTKEPIPYTSVSIKDTKVITTTDLEGKFKIIIPKNLNLEKITLLLKSIGYENTEVLIDKKDLPFSKDILLLSVEEVFIGEVCIIEKKSWWKFWE